MRKTIAASFLAGLLAISSPSPAADTQAVASVRTPAASAASEATAPQGEVPAIAVTPTRIEAVGDPGGPPVSVELTISNGGDADLVWDASEAEGGQATAGAVVRTERVGERWPLAGPRQRAARAAGDADDASSPWATAGISAAAAGASAPAGTEECGPAVEGILIVDDGTPENGLAQQRTVVQRFTPSFHPATFTNVCVSFYRTRPTPVASASFELVVFDASGEGGSPGQELGAVAAVTTNIPPAGIAGFVNIDISALNLDVAAGDVYIGVRFAGLPAGVWMGWDESPETPRSVAYLRTQTMPWESMTESFAPNLRSLMVRPVESGCVAASDVPWLTLTPAGGTTAAGAADTLIATLDPAALGDGLYRANVCIASNDPRRRKYSIPVAFEVGEVRAAAMVAPERLDLDVISGQSTVETIALTNLGTPGSVLAYTLAEAGEDCSAPSDVSWLKLTPESGSVGIGAVGSILVEADAAELDRGEYRAEICLATNDPDRPLIAVAVALTVAPTNLVFKDNFDPPLAVELAIDDGTPEDHVNATSGSFIWMNRFTPGAAELPLTLDRVAVYWSDQGIEVGQEFEIYVFTDPDGNLANGATLRRQILGIRVEKINAFQSIDLAPLTIEAKDGDVTIAVVNRTGMTAATAFPAAIDQDAQVGRSWVGTYLSGEVPVPPVLPANSYFGTIEEASGDSIWGNWLIRGFGTTPSGRPVELD